MADQAVQDSQGDREGRLAEWAQELGQAALLFGLGAGGRRAPQAQLFLEPGQARVNGFPADALQALYLGQLALKLEHPIAEPGVFFLQGKVVLEDHR